jgi:hypothetical protein
MIIRQFVETFRRCPMCHNELEIEARHKEARSDSNVLSVRAEHDALVINVKSPFFINADKASFDFSISLFNGQIMHCNMTNHFVSLYELNIILKKECRHCFNISKLNSFSRSISLFYDRHDSVFKSDALIDCFTFRDKTQHYYFCNNFEEKSSLLGINPLGTFDRSKIIKTYYVPFEHFDFDNRHAMITKMLAMQMLV